MAKKKRAKGMENKNIKIARCLAEKVAKRGGRAYFVGGYVRDRILKREIKDIDIEVHGMTIDALAEILDTLGSRMEIGSHFGIFRIRGYEVDIAMPRIEQATGKGHKDFSILIDPFLGTKKAAARRDFTVNSMMEDVLTGEVIDHFDGKQDLEERILRHVDSKTFPDDPLRVLRAAQFAARFHFGIARETIEISKDMDLSSLSGERVLEELKKALLTSDCPSVFFQILREMKQLEVWFPEVKQLIGIEQNPVYHPEGDVWNHTMLVIDEAAKLREEVSAPFYFMISALAHDFGKAVTTEKRNGQIV